MLKCDFHSYIDSFINQTQEEIRKFNDNIRQQYGSKDIVNNPPS